jgi:hypothetical protein
MSDSVPYSYLDLNPLLSQFSDGMFGIVDVCLAFFLIPSSYARGMSSVCFVSLPRYVGVGSLSYSHADVYNLANSAVIEDRRSFRASIPLLPRELYETTDGLDVPLLVLGIVFVTDPLDVDGYRVEDSRRFGGGLKEDHDNCYDVSLFDGERVSLEPSLVFEIPRSIYNDLRSRMLTWSPEVVGSDNPEDIVDQYVLEFIRSKVQKFSMLGTVQEIRIGS